MSFTLDTIAGFLNILFGIILTYWAIKDGDDKGFDYQHFRSIFGGFLFIFLGIILILKLFSFLINNPNLITTSFFSPAKTQSRQEKLKASNKL